MENVNLLETLRAFKAIFDNLPTQPLGDGDDYDKAIDQLYESYSAILHQLLATQHFAISTDIDGECVSIFSTEEERDSFVKIMRGIEDERGKTKRKLCKPRTFDEFLHYANDAENDLNNYSLDEDGAIEFKHN